MNCIIILKFSKDYFLTYSERKQPISPLGRLITIGEKQIEKDVIDNV